MQSSMWVKAFGERQCRGGLQEKHAMLTRDAQEVSLATGLRQYDLAWNVLQVAMVMPSVEKFGRRTFEESAG